MSNLKELKERILQYEQQEKELKCQVEELTDFLENGSVPLHWVDRNGIIIWANQAELHSLGYSKEEYIGFPISDFHADQQSIDSILLKLGNDEKIIDHRATLKCKDGSIKHVLINSSVFRRNGEFVHIRCVTIDISMYLKLAEEKSAKLAAIVESSDDAIVSKNLEGIVASWNHSAERTFGYSATEMIGESILKIIPEDRKNEEQLILDRLKSGERVEHFETKRITKYGSILDVSLTISPVKDLDNNIIGLSKIARDITEKKHEERRKNDFIAMVSHELKTPLTSITSYIQLVLAKARKDRDDFETYALSRAEVQTRKMTSMIQDFLSLAKLEEGKISINKEVFDLYPLVAEIISDAKFLANNHSVEFKGCGDLKINADKNKIGQVLINLISNAIKYSPKGGTVTIGCELQDSSVKVYVSDEGIGINPSDQRNLFTRFYRVKNEKAKNISGFGIGLYLVAEILRYHGSKIEVTSEENVGSTFSFTLPVHV